MQLVSSLEHLKENLTSAVVFSQRGTNLTDLCPVFRWLSSELSRLAALLSLLPLSLSFPPFLILSFSFLYFSQHDSLFSMSTLKPPNIAKIYADAEVILKMAKCELDSQRPKLYSS